MAATRVSPRARNRPLAPFVAVVAAVVLVTISAAAAERKDSLITFVTPTSGQVLSGPQKWEVGISDRANAVDVEFYLDGQQTPMWVEQRPPFVYGGDLGVLDTTKLSNGPHVLRIRAISPGKSTVETASITVQIQNGAAPPPPPSAPPPPQVSVVSPRAGQSVSGSVRWEAGVPPGTPVGAVDFFVDGANDPLWTEQVAPYVYNGDTGVLDTTKLSDGTHHLRVRLTTTGGATSSASTSVNVANSTPPPSSPPAAPTITSSPSATTTSTVASFAFTTATSGATLECSLDGAALGLCASPKAYSGLGAGQHTFAVRAVAGGLSSAVTSYTWRIDSTTSTPASCTGGQWKADYYANMSLSNSPTVQRCDERIDNEWGEGSPASTIPDNRFSARWSGTFSFTSGTTRFTITGDDGLRLKIDGTVVLDRWIDQPPTTYTVDRSLTQGNHQVTLEYFENGVNATAKLGWAPLSTIVPATPTITSNPTSPTTSATANFAYSSTTAGATYQCALDGAGFQACGASVSYTGLTVGSHTFQVRALAGTSASTPATYAWQVNAVAPLSTGTVFFNGDLATGDLSQWQDKWGMNLGRTPPGVTVVSTPAGYAAKVIVDPAFTDGSVSGPSTTMWEGNGSNTYSLPWQQRGADTWFHARYLFPDGTSASYPGRFQPMPTAGYAADWDVLMEWHSAPGAGYSSVVGIYGPKDGNPPRLHLRPVGNNTFHSFVETDRTQTKACNTPNPCGTPLALKYNHWYDITVHIKFSPDPSVGLIEWYVDGNLRFSDNLATMNYATDGSVPGVAFENGLYRSAGSSHVDTLYIQGVRAGSTRSAVEG